MRQGFVKVAAVTPNVRVADVEYNTQEICRLIDETVANSAKVIVFPELCLTGYTCGDLFAQDILLKKTEKSLKDIVAYTKGKDALIVIGLPYVLRSKLYNVAAVINNGELLGMTTKTYLPNYGEAYEKIKAQRKTKNQKNKKFDKNEKDDPYYSWNIGYYCFNISFLFDDNIVVRNKQFEYTDRP